MVSPKFLLLTLTTLLTTTTAVPKKKPTHIHFSDDPPEPEDWNISLRRYRDNYCTHPAASYGDWGIQRGPRTYISEAKGDKGECISWIDGDPFRSFEFKWQPRKKGYKPDKEHDDPTMGKDGKRKYCWIKVYEQDECKGKEMQMLPFANWWENIGACHGKSLGEGSSVRVRCWES